MGKPVAEPADRRGLRRRRDSAVGDHRLRAQGARRPAGADALRASATTSTRCRGARTTTTSSTSSSISRFGPAHERVRPLQPSQGQQLRAAAAAGRDRQPGERVRRGAQSADSPAASRTCSRRIRCSRCASACRGPRPARRRSAPARPNMLEAYGIPGLPTDAVFSGGSHAAERRRLDGVGPPEQQSAVSESVRRQRAAQLLVDRRHAHAEDRLRVPAHQHRSGRCASEVRRGFLRRAVQPARRRRRPTRRPSTSPIS